MEQSKSQNSPSTVAAGKSISQSELKPGDQRGRWILIDRAPDWIGRRRWNCVCIHCGAEAVINESYLLYLIHLRCTNRDCSVKRMYRTSVYPGQQFGSLTVINAEEYRRKRERMALCKCICGNEHLVAIKYLLSGKTKSCGCRGKVPPVKQR